MHIFPRISCLLLSALLIAPSASAQASSSNAASKLPPAAQSNDPSAPPADNTTNAAPLPATQTTENINTNALKFAPVPYLSQKTISQFKRPNWVIDPAKYYRAVLHTEKGQIVLDLYSQQAPKAVNSFVFLALNHFYDGTRFHRVIDGFMAQGGDGLSRDLSKKARWGTGGVGYNYFVELNEDLNFNAAGVLGVARSQSYFSQGSQFFITLAPSDFLTGGYTVFGKVVSGMETLKKLTKNYNNSGPIANKGADSLKRVEILVASK